MVATAPEGFAALQPRGLQRGLAIGREEGREEGKEDERERNEAAWRSTLEKLLVKRFEVIPPGVAATITAASAEQLQDWVECAVDAESVETLLGLAPEPQHTSVQR